MPNCQPSSLMRITKPQGFGLAVCCFGGDKRDRTADLLNAIYNMAIFYCLIAF